VDIYAFGIMLYEALTGKPPFEGDMFAVSGAHMHSPVPFPDNLVKRVGQGVCDVLAKTLSKYPEQRYSRATDIIEELQTARDSTLTLRVRREVEEKLNTREQQIKARRFWISTVLVIIGLIISFLGLSFVQGWLFGDDDNEQAKVIHTPTLTHTLEPAVAAQYTREAVRAAVNATDTAIAYPTVIAMEQTRLSAADTQTATARWTPSPTATSTPTMTRTPTRTPTLTRGEQALRVAEQGVDNNAEWAPYVGIEGVTERDFDGVTMVLVPKGCFDMGSTEEEVDAALAMCNASYGNCERAWFENELNGGRQCFDAPFWIDKYEVTNEQYGSSGYWSGDDLPRENISWFDSVAHCESRGARLPTEREWEYAARGPDHWIFPWGDDFDGTKVNFCDTNCTQDWADKNANDGFETTAFVGSHPNGVSWVGALNLSGNVWEWVSSLYEPYPYDGSDEREDINNTSASRVLRGGSWGDSGDLVRAAYRDWDDPLNVNNDVGFRCALSY
jgi:formylglycine-generating enzyme required for sulfatase activity